MSAYRLAIIDDEPGFCEFVVKVAETCGFETFATADADEFMDEIRAHPPLIIILDLKMPYVDGIELLRDLAAQDAKANILLASGVDEKIIEAGIRLGRERGLNMVGLLQKPIRLQDLKSILQNLLPKNQHITATTLENAIKEDQLRLHYQPRLDVHGWKIDGVEALVRWQHPELGLVPPMSFIPLAEKTGLISPLTDWVVSEAIRQDGDWHRNGMELGISINLSAANITDYDLPDRIEQMCVHEGIDPDCVTIELTESATMQDGLRLMDVFTRFRLKGFRLAIDDFGTGYSSLVQLQRLPFSELKIDKSFVMSMLTSEDSAVIVDTIIGMAHNLRMVAVAEGVEQAQVLEALAAKGCDYVQGYHIARPLMPEDVPTVVDVWPRVNEYKGVAQ